MHTLISTLPIRRDEYQCMITPLTEKWCICTFCYLFTYNSSTITILSSNYRRINCIPLNFTWWELLQTFIRRYWNITERVKGEKKRRRKNYNTPFKSKSSIYRASQKYSFLTVLHDKLSPPRTPLLGTVYPLRDKGYHEQSGFDFHTFYISLLQYWKNRCFDVNFWNCP